MVATLVLASVEVWALVARRAPPPPPEAPLVLLEQVLAFV